MSSWALTIKKWRNKTGTIIKEKSQPLLQRVVTKTLIHNCFVVEILFVITPNNLPLVLTVEFISQTVQSLRDFHKCVQHKFFYNNYMYVSVLKLVRWIVSQETIKYKWGFTTLQKYVPCFKEKFTEIKI